MKQQLKQLICGSLIVSLLAAPMQALAADLILNPGYITGRVTVNGFSPSSYQLYANTYGGGSSGNIVTTSPDYTLTVGIPEGGQSKFWMQGRVWTDANRNQMLYRAGDVTVADGATATFDFNIDPAVITGTASVNGEPAKSGSLVVRDLNTTWEAIASVGANGTFYFPTNIAGNKTIEGTLTRQSGDTVTFAKRPISITLGQTINYDIDVDLGTQTGQLQGSVIIKSNNDPVAIKTLNRTNVLLRSADGQAKTKTLPKGVTNYSFTDLVAGDWKFSPIPTFYFNDNDDYLQLPERLAESFTIDAGAVTTKNIEFDVAQIKGHVALTGSKGWESVAYAFARFYGHDWSSKSQADSFNYGGLGQDNFDLATGRYEAIVTPGNWNPLLYYFRFQKTVGVAPADYLHSYMEMRDYSITQTENLTAGQVVENKDYHFETGTVRINLAVADGSEISNPYVSGTCYDKNTYRSEPFRYAGVYAYGDPNPTPNATVTIVAAPYACTFNVTGKVGGTVVSFGQVKVDVVAGSDVILDLGGPQLTVSSPAGESYTTADSVTVSGKVTDDNGVAQVKVNGVVATLASTNNPADANEVSFTAQVSLQGGPNTITTVATDTAGKQSSESRVIYRDGVAPTLNWTPENGAALAENQVVVAGTASDDNVITSLKVNGATVAFTPTNNPAVPNEVSFSTTLALGLGTHQIVVSATDNSKRTTTQTHTVERVNNRAPIANAGVDQTVECTGAQTDVNLDGSASSDPDGDVLSFHWTGEFGAASGAKVTIPMAFGSHTASLNVNDGKGNSAVDTVNVNVVDTTAPTLSITGAPLIQMEATDKATRYTLAATAQDTCGGAQVTMEPNVSAYPLGETEITVTATDDHGLSASQAVMVEIVDHTAPQFDFVPAALSKEATAVVTPVSATELGTAQASDIFLESVSNDAQAGYGVGQHTVTWTATDSSGNNAKATQTVTITDTTPPTITNVSDIANVEATSSAGAAVTFTLPSASDLADASVDVSCSPTSGNTFALGTHTVSCKATDNSGNSASSSFHVSVVDTTAPTWSATPADITVVATGALTSVDLGTATAKDFFGPVSVQAWVNGQPAPTAFEVGTHVVTWKATDANGNVAEHKQTVRVQYAFGGFQNPLKQGGIYKLGRVLPVKILLTYADGTPVATAHPTLAVYQTSNGDVSGDPLVIDSVANSDSGNTLRYTGSDGQYIYNLDTVFATKGTYRIVVNVNDGSAPNQIDIAFK